MKKSNQILCYTIAGLVLAQMALLFLPFLTLDGVVYSIQALVWTKVEDLNKILSIPVNSYGPMLGITFGVSILTLVSLLVSPKGMLPSLFSMAWGALATYTYLTNPLLKMGNTGLRVAHIVLILLADALILARIYPWYYARYRSQD